MSPSLPIHLQGTTLEGGGQILRLALSLSSLTSTPISLTNIRGNRKGGGGLKSQHLSCVQWLSTACNAALSGASLKSRDITFTPDVTRSPYNEFETGEIHIQQSTPGSVNLILQAILPFILFSASPKPIRLHIIGGTNVSNSPSCEYIVQVLFPMLQLIGIPRITTTLHSRGWSQGSPTLGTVTYTITPLPNPLAAFQLNHRGTITCVSATILAPAHTEQSFCHHLAALFERDNSRFFNSTAPSQSLPPTPTNVDITFEDSCHEKRFYILLVATTSTGVKLGRDWLYDRAVRPGATDAIVPAMVKRVAAELIGEIEHGGCVDEYLRDQLVVFQALAAGRSVVLGGKNGSVRVEPSLHAKTAQWVARKILRVDFDDDGGCEGVGFAPRGKFKVSCQG